MTKRTIKKKKTYHPAPTPQKNRLVQRQELRGSIGSSVQDKGGALRGTFPAQSQLSQGSSLCSGDLDLSLLCWTKRDRAECMMLPSRVFKMVDVSLYHVMDYTEILKAGQSIGSQPLRVRACVLLKDIRGFKTQPDILSPCSCHALRIST